VGPPGPGRPNPPKSGIWPKRPKIPYFGGPPGKPRKRPFLGLRGATGGPPRGVDVKPPSREVSGIPKIALFRQKSPKRAKMAKNGQKGRFPAFLGFLRPLGAPRGSRKRGFYINPSRRGPAVPRRGGGENPRRPGAGVRPIGRPGGSPRGSVALGWAAASQAVASSLALNVSPLMSRVMPNSKQNPIRHPR